MNGYTSKSIDDFNVSKNNGNIVDIQENAVTNNKVHPLVDGKVPSYTFSQQIQDTNNKKKVTESVSLLSLMRYARPIDLLLMLIGTISALGHGAAQPALILFFGNLLEVFTSRASNLCSLNFTALSEQYCPSGVVLNSDNLYSSISLCNFTDSNFTFLSFDLKGEVQKQVYYLIGIGCGSILLGYLQVAFWSMAAERQTHAIRRKFFRAILHKEIAYFDTHKAGELNTQLTDDINKIHDGIGDKLGTTAQFLSTFITGFAIGFSYGWKLTLVILSMSPLLFAAAMLFSKLASRLTAMELKAYGKAGAIAEEVFSSIRTVFAYNGQEKEKQRYDKHLFDAKTSGIKKGMINGVTMGFLWLIINCCYALGFWYGAKLVRDGEYNVGNVMIVFFTIIIGVFNLGQAGPHFQALTEARAAAYIVWQVIDAPSKIVSDSEDGLKKDHLIGNIQFSNVHFHYPSRPEVEVLNGLSFDVKRGQTIALVGSSGSGKSTCVQLLQRFYDLDSGSVFIDDTKLNEYNLRWLRQHIGIVSQEPVLFHATIRENILLGRESATDAEIHEAAKMANAHDFIMTLPEKYETRVGERGAALSGGQKQRIAIARALIRDPRILLLDEATSALDNESEKVVQDALDRAAQGRTTLIIAHRLSTIRNADKIIVMHKGEAIEEGNHDSLMNARGTYYGLVEQQNLHKAEEEFELQEHTNIIPVEQNEKQKLTMKRERRSTITSITSAISAVIDGKKANLDGTEDDGDKELKKKTEENRPNVTWTMMKMNKPEWLLILIGCIASICNGGLQPAVGIVMAKYIGVFQECDENEQERLVLLYVLLFVGFGIISLLAMFLQNFLFASSGEALTQRLRSKAFHAILRQEIAYFDQPTNNTGALCARLATDASAVQGATGIRLGVIGQNIAALGTGIIISFVFSWQLTLLIFGFVPFMIIGAFLESRLMTGFASSDKKSLEDASKVTVESIQNIRTVAQLTKETHFYNEYSRLLIIPYRSAMKRCHIIGVCFSVSDSVMYFTLAALFALGAFLVDQNTITFNSILIVFTCMTFSATSVGQSASLAPDYGKAQDAAKQIFDLFDRKPVMDNGSTDGDEIPDFKGQLEFNDVYFTYPNRPQAIILKNFKLKINPGQKVALVGTSGCGKSTSIQLIERFYDVNAGCLMADSKDIRNLNLQWYRSQLGVVSQEPILFDMSIRENIAYGDNNRNDIPMEEIVRVAKDANIHDFIRQLPQGYETNCGANGTQLSGGQKQRIAIARALLRNPKILLLDEATSALDSESEKVVQDALDRAQENRTSITIAHRLSTIQNSNVICVVHNGIIVEKGTHEELLALGGHYYRLAQSKLK